MRTIVHFLVVTYVIKYIEASEELELQVHKPPAVYGDNVKLICNIGKNLNKNCRTLWKAGDDYKLLSHNGISSDKTKYNETKEPTGFGLIIYNFNRHDNNMNYSCSCNLKTTVKHFHFEDIQETASQQIADKPSNNKDVKSDNIIIENSGEKAASKRIADKPANNKGRNMASNVVVGLLVFTVRYIQSSYE